MTLDAKLILAIGIMLVFVALLATFAYDALRAEKKSQEDSREDSDGY